MSAINLTSRQNSGLDMMSVSVTEAAPLRRRHYGGALELPPPFVSTPFVTEWGLYYSHNDVCALQYFQQPKARSNNRPVGTLCYFKQAGLDLHRKPGMWKGI